MGVDRHAWPTGSSEMADRIRDFDWAATPLGALAHWSASLRTIVDVFLPNGFPMIALIGDDLLQIYNDGYRVVLGDKHPDALGQPTRACWPEVWEINAPIYRRVSTGETVTFEDRLYPLFRDGALEDAWFIISYSPLRDGDSRIIGVLVTMIETTARILAERQQRINDERFRALAMASADIIYRMGPDWREMRRLEGRGILADTVEPSETWLERYIHPDDQPTITAAIGDAVQSKREFVLEHRVVRAEGTLGWISSRALPLLDDRGEIVEWVGTAIDVTSRREADEALRESEERFRAIVEEATDYAIFTTDVDGTIDVWTPGAQAVLGWTDVEAVGQPFHMTYTPEDRAAGVPERELEGASAREKVSNVRWHVRNDGAQVFIDGVARGRFSEDGTFLGLIKIGQDVTERRLAGERRRQEDERVRAELEARVTEATAELRTLSRRLLMIQEEERRFLANELHDEIGQMLTGLGLTLGTRTVPDQERLTEARTIVAELTEQVRQLSMDLRPAALDSYGLLPALRWHLERYERLTGIHVQFSHEGLERRFDSSIEIAAYRIVQEALTNVARHAATASASVRLFADADTLIVSIRDEGRGFDSGLKPSSTGLGGMRERAELLGGRLTIDASLGQGVAITAELPTDQTVASDSSTGVTADQPQ